MVLYLLLPLPLLLQRHVPEHGDPLRAAWPRLVKVPARLAVDAPLRVAFEHLLNTLDCVSPPVTANNKNTI